VDVGDNIGAKLQSDQAEADKRIAQAKAEERRVMAVALEQEMKARTQEMQAKLVEAEAQIPLAMAAIHIAVSPKSNSAYKAISQARELVRKQGAEAVPPHLAGGPRPGDSRDEYLYPHDHPRGWVAQQYLPSQVEPVQFYHPGDNPREARIAAYLADLKGAAGTAPGESGEAADPSKGE